ncbi:GntP family permease [Corynebacterium variabile]|uniref:Gluconate:H+ symporter, GntP family protein n=1 Tax=Corynebacterium variabile TaxID=1727 RepID=A0A3C0MTP7_9CORY|nr:gluconate:H+ symporter [Corynebacterium variabile]MDN6241202.1 GntP family permease [Corynebacterium variabile]MDN6477101.1 GntP family permease [Corynebacterium variabile]MDN6535463.1 GntP family permease [Corynebacterium variabile]MDN6661572.1 GntP family permease [Corynebacterium variabile]MDN6676913.1 GntP family permease [Corynebacterium variabile]
MSTIGALSVLAEDEVVTTASDSRLVVSAVVGIALIIVLIVWAKVHPFLSLMLGSAGLALIAGIPLVDTFSSFTSGFGGTVGDVGVLIALGAVIGQFLVTSGAADSIVDAFLDKTAAKWRPWVIAGLAMLLGIPLFFEVGIVLLIPVVILAARRSNLPLILLGVPALAGLSALHALVPPHPGPLIAVDALQANLGLTLALGLLVAVPVVAIAGPLSAKIMATWVPIPAPAAAAEADKEEDAGPKPSVVRGLTVVLLPVVMMLSRTIVESTGVDEGSAVYKTFEFLGEPIVALLATVLVGMTLLGFFQGRTAKEVSDTVGASFGPIASVILIVGAGGGFKQTLVDTGVADIIGDWVQDAPVSTLVAGWLVAVFIRLATGSATVATVTAAGIMAPLAEGMPSVEVALLVLAIGAGSVFFSHVNDAGFWLVKEYFGMTVPQTLKTWSLMETVLSVTALIVVLLVNLIV